MSLWRQLGKGLRVLTNRRAADQEIDDEVRHYFEQTTADLIAKGLSPEAARKSARAELGSASAIREQVRDYGWENVVATFFSDLSYAGRRLRHAPGFTIICTVTLALGIGASTAIFSALNPILFQPLPYPEAGRILTIWDQTAEGSRLEGTFGTYRELADRTRSFDSIAVLKAWQPTITGPAEPERLDGQSVSVGYFRVLGTAPAIGRDFDSSDDRLHGPRVAILSEGLWRRRFAADPALIGHQISLDGESYTVIGIMPRFENVLAPSAELWSPLQYDMSLGSAWGHHLRMIGRLRPGVAVEQARQELRSIAFTPQQEFPRPVWASAKLGFLVRALQEDITGGVKPALIAILGAVLLLLAIACVNVTNLLLARGSQRRAELAMRLALGAGRWRMIRQLLTESFLLAILGGALGMAAAEVGVRALVALSPPGLPRVAAISLDGTSLTFGLGITTLIGLAVGVVPAWYASRDLNISLKQSFSRTATGHQWAREILVIAEVALALMLLVSSGLLLRSLQRLFSVAPGFEAAHLLTMQVQTSGHRFDDNGATRRFFAQALDAVRSVPGVASAGFSSQLPLSGDQFGTYGVSFESSRADHVDRESAFRYAVSPGYVEAMGIALRRGRLLDSHDSAGAPVSVLLSESFAKRKFPGEDPIGKRIHVGPDSWPWATITGVVGDVKQMSLALGQTDAFYMSSAQGWFADNAMWLVVRVQGEPAALVPAIKQAIWSVDKDQPIFRVSTMDTMLAGSAAERHFVLILFEAFAVVALLLAALGIYGVLSGSVTERTREIGLRSALGASRNNVLALVVRQGMTLTGIGVLIGLGGAAAATQVLVTMLFGVSRLDPITYVGVVLLLVGTSGFACLVPAWRAVRVDPAITLRAE